MNAWPFHVVIRTPIIGDKPVEVERGYADSWMTNPWIGTVIVRSITRRLFPPYTFRFLNHYYMWGFELYLYNYLILHFIFEGENKIADITVKNDAFLPSFGANLDSETSPLE